MVLSPWLIYMGNNFYGRCHIILLKYPISGVELSGLEKVKFIALVLPFPVLKCFGESVFNVFKSWLLSKFSTVFFLL